MKKFICFLIITVLLSCSSTNNSNTGQRKPAGEDWRISEKEHKEIKDRLKECGLFKRCHNTNIIDVNNEQYQYLLSHYPNFIITKEEVRYTHKQQHYYGTLWGLPHNSAASKVRGYKTQIFSVKNPTDKTPTVYYYFAKICPPPPSCKPDSS